MKQTLDQTSKPAAHTLSAVVRADIAERKGQFAEAARLYRQAGDECGGHSEAERRYIKAKQCEEQVRLIAAAPELLAALQAVLEFADNGTPIQPGADVISEARASIAAATRDPQINKQ